MVLRVRRGRARPALLALGISAVVLAVVAPLAAAATLGEPPRVSTRLTGGGSTFPLNYVQSVIAEYAQRRPRMVVKYIGNDSPRAVDAFLRRRHDFAGIDRPLSSAGATGAPGGTVLYFPLAVAPIAVVYNLEDVKDVRLSPDTLAAIFDGAIARWNAPAIALDNPGVDLPDLPITVVHDAQGSDTSQNFTAYLARTAPEAWTPSDPSSPWPSNSTGGAGNFGVAQIVKTTPGTIGYVDYPNAHALALAMVSVKNALGAYVAPSVDGATAAASVTAVNTDLTFDPSNALGATVYPITMASWMAVYAHQTEADKAAALRSFLRFVYRSGQDIAAKVDYAALPPEAVRLARVQIAKIEAGAA